MQAALTAELLLPLVALITYVLSGFFFNFNNYYVICNLVYLFIFSTYLNNASKNTSIFFLMFFSVLALNLFGYIFYSGIKSGSIDFFKTCSRYYIFIFLGFALYKSYYQTGKEIALLRWVVYFALFIGLINFLHFLLLVTDDVAIDWYKISFNRYTVVYLFIKEINPSLSDYIVIGYQYDGLLKPPGYFFDTHAQYYLPLGASVILLFKELGFKYRKTLISFLLISILVSGIKTAYMSIVLLGAIYLLTNLNSAFFIKYLRIFLISMGLIFIVLGNYILIIFGGESLYKILAQLWSHFIEIPVKLAMNETIAFLFGGAPFLRGDKFYYSEVFFVTVTIYIGLLGLLFYLMPTILLKRIRSRKLPAYVFLVFLLSLSHYSVYMIGINNLFSALSFMYFFALINNEPAMKGSVAG